MKTENTQAPPGRTRFPWRWIVLAVALFVVGIVFPPIRIVPLASDGERARPAGGMAAFDAPAFAAAFWSERLQPAAATAPELDPILAELQRDPMAAAKRFARRVGLGTTAYYFARGTGRVIAVEKSRLLVAIDGVPDAVVAVRTGPIFGNAVRDGSGLLEVNDVPGLAEFNALAAELNRLVEERVQPALSGVEIGMRLAFAGCAEAPENVGSGPLLTFIPVQVEMTP